MPEKLTALPLERCPCGGELRLVVTAERDYSLGGHELGLFEEVRLHCMVCDDWALDRIPGNVSLEAYEATIAAACAALGAVEGVQGAGGP